MDGNEQESPEAAMTALIERVVADTRLRAELERARRTFLGQAPNGAERLAGPAAERRFYEWFVLERESETLGQVPRDVDKYGVSEELDGSIVGAFGVTAVSPQWVTARDLQDDAMLEFSVPADSLAVGDMVVGRLFVVGAGRWLPSSAASVFRPGGSLGEAFSREVKKLELDRRLQQIEIEHTLLRPQAEGRLGQPDEAPPAPPLEHLEADLDRLLQNQAKEFSATAISEQLAAVARPGQVVGPLLEEIAFETAADLDAVRRVLLEIWNAQHRNEVAEDRPADISEGPPGETLGERMVRRLDEGLGKKQDIDGLFSELEEMAGLETGAADDGENPFDRETRIDPDADPLAEPGAGNLAPLVEEYLWELGVEGGPVATTLRTWVELQGNAAVPRNDVEDVTGTDLMRVLLHIFLAASPKHRSETVRTAFDALKQFYDWAEQTQELELAAQVTECRGALLDQLDRLAAASTSLSTTVHGEHGPAMFEVEEIGPKGFGMRDDEGGGYWVDVPDSVTGLLMVGDLLLGALARTGGFAGPVTVLPAEVRSLME